MVRLVVVTLYFSTCSSTSHIERAKIPEDFDRMTGIQAQILCQDEAHHSRSRPVLENCRFFRVGMRKTAVDDDVCDGTDADRILAEHDGGGIVEVIIEILARIFEAFPRIAPGHPQPLALVLGEQAKRQDEGVDFVLVEVFKPRMDPG